MLLRALLTSPGCILTVNDALFTFNNHYSTTAVTPHQSSSLVTPIDSTGSEVGYDEPASTKYHGPYKTPSDFAIANNYIFDDVSLRVAWKLYSTTIHSYTMKPAILYSFNDYKTMDHPFITYHAEGECIASTGRLYTPALHSLNINAAWMLANIHKGRPFILLSHLKNKNVGYKNRTGQLHYSALTREVKCLKSAGYELTKFSIDPDSSIYGGKEENALYSPSKPQDEMVKISLNDLKMTSVDCRSVVDDYAKNHEKYISGLSKVKALESLLNEISTARLDRLLHSYNGLEVFLDQLLSGISGVEMHSFIDHFNEELSQWFKVKLANDFHVSLFSPYDPSENAEKIKKILLPILQTEIKRHIHVEESSPKSRLMD